MIDHQKAAGTLRVPWRQANGTRRVPAALRLALVCSLALLPAGCSSKKVEKHPISGRLTQGGKPLKVDPMVGMIQIVFYPAPDGVRVPNPDRAGIESAARVRVDAEGNFEVPGGLPAGKYIIVVRKLDSGPTGPDALKDRFSYGNSKIIEEVSEERTLDIDLDRYQ